MEIYITVSDKTHEVIGMKKKQAVENARCMKGISRAAARADI